MICKLWTKWISAQSLHRMDERRQLKTEINNARTRNKKEAQYKYQEQNKSKRASDKINVNDMQDLETTGKEAVTKGNIKELYNVTRQICGKGRSSGGPIKDSSGKLIAKKNDQMERWKEYFSSLLNQPAPFAQAKYTSSQQQSIDKLRASIQRRDQNSHQSLTERQGSRTR